MPMEQNLRVLKGIVVREVKTRESRRLLTILTEEGGRIQAAARSADRKNSRQSQAACQLLSYSEFTIFDYRDRMSINEAELIDMFPEIQRDVFRLSLASYVCDTAAGLGETDLPDNEVFRLTMNTLHALARTELPLGIIKAAFEVRVAGIAGYAIDLETCDGCGEELSAALVDTSAGAAYCTACGARRPAGEGLHYLPHGAMLAFRYLLVCDLKRLFAFKISKREARALGETAERYITAQVGPSRLLEFYHSLSRTENTYESAD